MAELASDLGADGETSLGPPQMARASYNKMKKFALLALSSAVWLSPALADTTLYGSARLSVTYSDDDLKDGTDFEVRDENSRLGFRGSEDLGRGLSAIYHYEFGVNAAAGAEIGGSDVGGRLSLVGLRSSRWGQVSLGRQWDPYYFAVAGEVDTFNGINSANGYYANGGTTRADNMLYYGSPTFFGGLSLYGAIQADGEQGDTDIDRWQIAAIYDNGPLFLGAGWVQVREDVEGDGCGVDGGKLEGETLNQYGIQGRYFFSNGIGLAGSVQKCDNDGSGDEEFDATNVDLLVNYSFMTVRIQLGGFWRENRGGDGSFERAKLTGWILGFQGRLSKRTRIYLEYGDNNSRSSDVNVRNFAMGMRHDF